MADPGSPSDPYKTQFDRIVARLRAGGSAGGNEPTSVESSKPAQQRMGDVAFSIVWLTIIVTLSIVVGGLIGLVAAIAAVIVGVRLMLG